MNTDYFDTFGDESSFVHLRENPCLLRVVVKIETMNEILEIGIFKHSINFLLHR